MLEDLRCTGGVYVGCKTKVQTLTHRTPGQLCLDFEDEEEESPLDVLVSGLELLFRELYLSVDFVDMERRYGVPKSRAVLHPKRRFPDGHVPSDCLSNHERIISLFDACSAQTSRLPSDYLRTQDQFADLIPDKDIFPLVSSEAFNGPRAPEIARPIPSFRPAKRQKTYADSDGLCGEGDDVDFFGPAFNF